MRSLDKSRRHYKKANTKLPLGVASSYRYWGDDSTIYVHRGKGGRLWDIDGNEYIDYRLGFGPIILGYADERIDEAARAGMGAGGVFGLSTELEYQVACRLSDMVPAAELIRFANSGSEAVMAALRIARAYSGKDEHILVEGGYHGVFSEVLWYADVEDWEPGHGKPKIRAGSKGVPKMFKSLVHTVPLNDANVLEDELEKHGDRIGALLIEPILGNCCGISASAQYMRDVRSLCDRHDVVLIVDEVKTGFRVARGGVQELLGVSADLCTFAKSIANGYPLAAVAGREDIMRMVGDSVAQGGTFNAHPVALAAADKTLEILAETDALETVASAGEKLRAGIGRILKSRGIAHSFAGHPAMSGLFFDSTTPSNYRQWLDSDYEFYDSLAEVLHDLGVLIEPDSREPWFLCEAHDDGCIAETLKSFEKAVDICTSNCSGEHGRISLPRV
ncbi:MAG: aminotransferase class III-fold pyridoxal phosphate-dependent enzyme [Woeseiaceae bacterium]|nr:aminotransferase class III-fold pyridoxal phosphate-dependent enzyme [Woeseiaceae bacterium]